jgi:hypothetical protein
MQHVNTHKKYNIYFLYSQNLIYEKTLSNKVCVCLALAKFSKFI